MHQIMPVGFFPVIDFSKKLFVIFYLMMSVSYSLKAQITDDFTDGDFSTNPAWAGDDSIFTVNAGKQLQSNGYAQSDTAFLSTAFNPSFDDTISWEFFVKMTFSPSDNNRVSIFLASSSANLQGSLNGYYLRIGENGSLDAIKLYRQSGSASTLLLTGSSIYAVSAQTRIKVVRDPSANWTIYSDSTGGTNFTTEGTITDNTFNTSAFFGIWCKYSSTNSKNFFFDDFIISGSAIVDSIPPTLSAVSVISSTALDLQFSEPVALAEAEDETNYSVNNGIGNPGSAIRDTLDSSLVHLVFSSSFATGTAYTISISNLKDSAGNIMLPASQNFNYFVSATPAYKDVLINEFLADISPAPSSLPAKEYLELYNSSSKIFDLSGWKYAVNSSSKTLPSFTLMPGAYLILCSTNDTALFSPYGGVLGISSWAALVDGGASVSLQDNNSTVIDGIAYSSSWPGFTGGKSMELINPENDCGGINNWAVSVDTSGGSPGKINSVADTTTDILSPSLIAVNIISSTEIELVFDEIMDSSSLVNGAYTIDNGLTVISAFLSNANSDLVTLSLQPQLDTAVVYTVSVANVTDCPGNPIGQNDSLQFFIAYQPSPGEIIINEIFADPTPSQGLPNAEFAELYNRTNKPIDLSNCSFSGATFPQGTSIQAKGYLILCYDTSVAYYSAYGAATKMNGWSTSFLTNSGKDLILSNGNQQLDRVFYDLSWYHDGIKDDGGWSLELINPENPCSGATNWTASIDPAGGTPGKINSVNDTTPDGQAPSLSSVNIVSLNQIEVNFSEAMDSAGLSNGIYLIDNGISVDSIRIEGSLTVVTVLFSPPIDTAVVYTLHVSNVYDCSGNQIGPADSAQFAIGYQPAAGDLIINEILADPETPVGLPNAEFAELFNRSSKFLDLSNCTFSGSNFPQGTTLPPNGYLILCYAPNASLLSGYGKTAAMTGWSGSFLTNSGKDLSISLGADIIDRVFYDVSWYNDNIKDDGGWSLERINPDHPCSSADNWSASADPSGGTPGKQNSIFSIAPDTQAPSIISVIATGQNELLITFSEGMDSASLTGNYSINNGISVTGFIPQGPDFTSVILNVSPNLDSAILYSGNISSVSDCSGNAVFNLSFSFGIGVPANPFDVIINEIYPDPNSSVSSLPEAEFVELFNTTNTVINLDNFKFSDGSTVSSLGKAVILPNSYLILCPSANISDYASYGNTLGLTSFPSLNNTGDWLSITNSSGSIIHEVNYSDNWYRDDVKKAGGWTLELIDPGNPCGEENNWRASNDLAGGTPGKVNSVNGNNPDSIPPQILSVFAVNSLTVRLYFNENVDSLSALAANYSISNGINVFSRQVIDRKTLQILLTDSLQYNIIYTVSASGMFDCMGNTTLSTSGIFALTQPATPGDIVISEIFPDPDENLSSLPGKEFVELFNASSKTVNLKNFRFTDGSSISTLAEYVLYPSGYLILSSSTNAADFKNYGTTMGLASFPSLNNTGELISLYDSTGNLIHEVNYSDDWYGDETKKEGGWTLEMIDANNPCGESNNWRASNDLSGGTPGKINSIIATNPDLLAPVILAAYALSADSVILYFNETMDSLSAAGANYSINNGIIISSVSARDKKTVVLKLSVALQVNIMYTVSASGMSDCVGNMSLSNTAEFALSEQGVEGDVIINEVLFNPRTNGSDFVEIYNKSGKIINLEGWTLARFYNDSISDKELISELPLVIFPGKYVVFTKDTANIRKEYPLGKSEFFIQLPAIPSYNDDTGTVILINNQHIISDLFSFDEDMHFELLKDVSGVSLERIDFNRPSSDKTNWHSAAEAAGWATPGYQNSQYNPALGDGSVVSVQPEIFSPDNDGYNDVVNIIYKFDSPGFTATVIVFDAKGRQIKILAKNSLLAPEGAFSWDGISDSGEKARIGIYLIWVEAFDLRGEVLHFKKTCVLAGKLD